MILSVFTCTTLANYIQAMNLQKKMDKGYQQNKPGSIHLSFVEFPLLTVIQADSPTNVHPNVPL